MSTLSRWLPAVGAGLASLVFAVSTCAQATVWPERAVRLIVPLPPGSAPDVSARLFAEHLAARWKQPVIVENLPGADGIVAVKEFVGRRDGHTLLYSFAGPITINPLLHEKLPYDPVHDLQPVAMASDNFLAIAVAADTPASSIGELLAWAGSRPGKLNWAATAGLPYFAFAGLLAGAGIANVYVPYRDFNPALADLQEGRLDAVSTGATQLLPHHQAGRLKLLVVLNRTRSPAAPQVPTAAEAGYPQLTFDAVTGFFAGREMPAELRERIAADVRAVAGGAAVRQRLDAIGIAARGSTPAEFAAAIDDQRRKVTRIAADVGTRPGQ
jgi:tripartite-type tricarboxylate transporter receptor subunit TctC